MLEDQPHNLPVECGSSQLRPARATSCGAIPLDTINSNIPSITPPVLPLAFANALLTLYTVNDESQCKLHLLGKLFTSITGHHINFNFFL